MAIRLKSVSKSFGGAPVIDRFSYDFPERGVVAIVGKSGRGKTTLLHLILGLIAPDSGSIEGAGRIGAVFQEDRLIPSMNVTANLRLIGGDEAEIDRHLRAVGLYDDRMRPVGALSGGMKRRLAIARAVLYRCEAMAMDEPYKGLDADTRAQIADYVLRECRDRLILFVSHEPEEIQLMQPIDIIHLEEAQP